MKDTIFSSEESTECVFTTPIPEYYKWYKWRQSWTTGFNIALVTYRQQDIILCLNTDNGEIWVNDPSEDFGSMLYMGLKKPSKKLIERAQIWEISGYYRSMHLNRFLEDTR